MYIIWWALNSHSTLGKSLILELSYLNKLLLMTEKVTKINSRHLISAQNAYNFNVISE